MSSGPVLHPRPRGDSTPVETVAASVAEIVDPSVEGTAAAAIALRAAAPGPLSLAVAMLATRRERMTVESATGIVATGLAAPRAAQRPRMIVIGPTTESVSVRMCPTGMKRKVSGSFRMCGRRHARTDTVSQSLRSLLTTSLTLPSSLRRRQLDRVVRAVRGILSNIDPMSRLKSRSWINGNARKQESKRGFDGASRSTFSQILLVSILLSISYLLAGATVFNSGSDCL